MFLIGLVFAAVEAADEKEKSDPEKRLYAGTREAVGFVSIQDVKKLTRPTGVRNEGPRIQITTAEALLLPKDYRKGQKEADKLGDPPALDVAGEDGSGKAAARRTGEERAATASIPGGPRYVDFPWYSIGNQRIKFITQSVAGAYDYNSINSEALRLIREGNAGNWRSHIWDDQWYWYSLPDNVDKYFLMVGYSPDEGKYVWAAVRNRPDFWEVRAWDGSYTRPGNDSQVKKRTTINGYTIDLDIFNPDNEGDWTPNDFWYSFGY
jgi:hypothetical protein